MEFVTATANLRSIVYGIEPIKSFFEIKSMAGSIVPIVATTNAIVAGFMVQHALSVLQQSVQLGPSTKKLGAPPATMFLVSRADQLISRENLHPPLSTCPVCSRCYITLSMNTKKTTVHDLVQYLIRLVPYFQADNLCIMDGTR
jgi:ubiquitin-like 1-activating enzyme E1 B